MAPTEVSLKSVQSDLFLLCVTLSPITIPKFAISQSEAMCTVLISFDIKVTDLIWLRNHGHMAVIGYGRHLILPFLVRSDSISGSFGLARRIRSTTSRQNTWPNQFRPSDHDTVVVSAAGQ